MINKSKIKVCCICTESIKPQYLGKDKEGFDYYWYEGNNAQPVADGVCCDTCNSTIVIPKRINDISMSYNLDNFNKTFGLGG